MLGEIAAGVLGLVGGLHQNATNAATAQKQMDFQREMSDTSYQRGVKDMKAAGLNPMLAYSQGGASSAAGASYNAANVGEAAVRGVESGVNSAVKSRMVGEQLKNMAADTDLKRESAKQAGAAIIASLAQAQLANTNSARVTALLPWEEASASAHAGIAMNDMIASNIMGDYVRSDPGRIARSLALAGRDAADATSAVRNFGLSNLLGGTTTTERYSDKDTGDSYTTTRKKGAFGR